MSANISDEEEEGEVEISGGLIDRGPAVRPPPPRGHKVGEGHALNLGDAEEEVDDGEPPTSSCSRYNEAGDTEADPTASATRECEPLLARGSIDVDVPAKAPQHAPARGGDVLVAKSCCGNSGGLLRPPPPPPPLDLERGECESELIVRSIASDMASSSARAWDEDGERDS